MKRKVTIFMDYIAHLLTGGLMFVALLLFGGGLNLLIQWAAPIIGDSHFETLMFTVEKVILYADVLLLVWWSIFSTYRALRELMQ